MAKVNFYLKGAISEKQIREAKASGKEINLKKELQIFLMVSSGGRRVQVYTKKRIAQLNWNSEKQVVRCTKGLEGCNELQEWLAKVKAEVIRKCNDLESNGESITKQDLDAYLNKKTLQKVQTVDFEDCLNDFIQCYKTIAGYSLKPNTVKKYKGLGQHVKDFCSANDQAFSLQIINQGFIERFKAFLAQELELSDNTVTKYVKALKTFAKYLIEKELIRTINLHKIRVTEKEGEIYVLTIKQILDLQHFEINEEYLSRVRDVFCFMCWTGQRYSDILRIRQETLVTDENGNMSWELITEKTNEKIKVPIVNYALEILERYKDDILPLPLISNQKMNQYLKKLGEIAELNVQTKVVRYYDGRRDEQYFPFHQVLTTHVARKSYITNSLILGIPERVVREVSGHKDEKSFRRYIKLAESYKSQVIQKAFSKENIEKALN